MTDIDIHSKVGGTDVTIAELALIGEAVLNLAAAAPLMRHATPVGTLDYALAEGRPAEIVRDFATWCGRGGGYSGCRDRLLGHLDATGWSARVFSKIPSSETVTFLPSGGAA